MEIKLENTQPVFAHDVMISTIYKTSKTKKGNIKKEAYTELMFLDIISKQAIARVVLPSNVLKILPHLLIDNLKKIKKELKNKEMPKKEKVEINSTNASYLG